MDVSAIITTSMTDSGVIGAFAVPSTAPISVAASAAIGADQAEWMRLIGEGVSGETVNGAVQAVYPTEPVRVTVGGPDAGPADGPALGQERGTTLLSELATLSPAAMRAYVSGHPDAVAGLLASPPPAGAVAAWWDATGADSRTTLTDAAPQLVGNLEGIPYQVRSVANERFLTETISALQGKLATAGRAAADDLRARLHMLQQVKAALDGGAVAHGTELTDPQSVRRLIGLDVTGSGRAVISVGNLATADYVSFMVPGMFYSIDSELVSWTNAAADLAAAQRAWLARLHPGSHETVATVAWIGYQTPSAVDVASMDLARAGQVALTDSLHGLAAVRGDQSGYSGSSGQSGQSGAAPYVSVLTHSYGATVALLSLAEDDVTVDALAMVGSPGSPAQSVADLKVRGGNVWVAEASLDPVADAGVFGSQPLSESYGAHRFGVTGAVDPMTGSALAGSLGHVDYFTTGSESFRNMALIGIGEGSLVLDPDGHAAAAQRARAVG